MSGISSFSPIHGLHDIRTSLFKTHRCHKKEFLLKFARDRRRWLHWLYEAKKRYGLCVLNYVVTSNHIHLLVRDSGPDVIPKSLQLIAGRTAQEYNNRKNRNGAYWEDRYHATAVETDAHLFRCLVYIDLNMVRAGVVSHPSKWPEEGYREIQSPPQRYRIIDLTGITRLCGEDDVPTFQQRYRQWVEEELKYSRLERDASWSNSIAVGSSAFVEKIQAELGTKAKDRTVTDTTDKSVLRESRATYTAHFYPEMGMLRGKNRVRWDV